MIGRRPEERGIAGCDDDRSGGEGGGDAKPSVRHAAGAFTGGVGLPLRAGDMMGRP